MAKAESPIRSIAGKTVVPPSTYEWDTMDISNSNAGRATEDGLTHKNTIRKVVKVLLTWEAVTLEEAAEIVKAVDTDYFKVVYLDLKKGGFREAEFYVGDRSAPLRNAKTGLWSLSFNIIER